MRKQLVAFVSIMLLTTSISAIFTLYPQDAKALDVEGLIQSDTMWTLSNSPYTVKSDVTIAHGAKLSILPGVEVRFEKGSSLIVNGSLYAVGETDNRISLTSNANDPVSGDWNGIKFYGDKNATLTVSYCALQFATIGITIESLGKAVIEESRIASNSVSGVQANGAVNLLIQGNTLIQNANGISSSGIASSGLKIINNKISNNGNGVYLNAYGENGRINNVTISDNAFKANTNGVYLSSSGPSVLANAYISNIIISSNLMDSNKYGMYLVAQGWGQPGLIGGGARIYDSAILDNTIFSSDLAIFVNSTSNWYSWIFNLIISGNTVYSSQEGLLMHAFRTPQPPIQDAPFDVTVLGNTVSANGRGISVSGDLRVNFTGNSLSYNSYGIYLISSVTSESVASNNDIYENTAYGIYVDENVAINAQYNYWGASSGPYHEALHPSGAGDRINGNGENLVFEPFSTEPFGTINEAPVAILTIATTTVMLNQTVVFDGTDSHDDSSILKYFFDFGDGVATHQSTGLSKHTYTSPGVYNASLVVMDDLGVNSTNEAGRTIDVIIPALVVSASVDPLNVFSEGDVMVQIHVSDGEDRAVQEALVQLTSDNGGGFQFPSGYTDSNGYFASLYSAPSVSQPVNIKITATASKEGYQDDYDDAYLFVLTRASSNGTWLDHFWLILLVSAAAIAIAAVFLVRKRRKATTEVEAKIKPKGRDKLQPKSTFG